IFREGADAEGLRPRVLRSQRQNKKTKPSCPDDAMDCRNPSRAPPDRIEKEEAQPCTQHHSKRHRPERKRHDADPLPAGSGIDGFPPSRCLWTSISALLPQGQRETCCSRTTIATPFQKREPLGARV